MIGFLIRLLIAAAGLWLASFLVSGVEISSTRTLLLAALLLGLINAVIRPVIVVLTLPLTILTLGLFLLIINAGMVSLTAWLLPGMEVDGFWSAIFAAIIVALTGWIGSGFIGDSGKMERYEQRRR